MTFRVVSCVVVSRWTDTGSGSPDCRTVAALIWRDLTRSLDQIRAKLMEHTGLPQSAFFLVKVPALNARFVGHYQQRRSS
jgi:hypothetical protein